MGEFDFLLNISVFKEALQDQRKVLREFWTKGRDILEDSGVTIKPIPKKWLSLRHNYFSVLFIVVLYVLNIPAPRLKFYARLNHCLRTWVTACDNLLDEELKELIMTDLPVDARVFKSVHTILVADRIFFSFLLDALKEGVITEEEMRLLISVSLSAMTESGREEAEEESGVDYTTSPVEVLSSIHRAKTGILFTSPLRAPLALGDIDAEDERSKDIIDGLCSFGLACQILDDLSDIGHDIYSRKHNYLASLVMSGSNANERSALLKLLSVGRDEALKRNIYLYQKFPHASKIAVSEARSQFNNALGLLCKAGLPLNKGKSQMFIKALMAIVGHPRLFLRLRG